MNLNTIIGHNRVIGIEVNFTSETNICYHAVLVNLHKGKLKLESIEQEYHNFDQLMDVIPPKTPVCLILTGKGVVIKEYEKEDDTSDESILKLVFPFAKVNEFSMNTYSNDKGNSWAAVVRNEQLTNITNTFIEAGKVVLDVFIGPLILEHLLLFLDDSDTPITTSSYKVEFNNINITKIDKYSGEEKLYEVSGKKIGGSELLPFAASYTHLAINQGKSSGKINRIIVSANDFKVNKVLALFMKVGIALLFMLLMVNFFAYGHYNNKVNSVNQDVFYNRSLLTKKKKLETELKEKKQLLARTGLDTQSHLSYYADVVASLRPKNIVFVEMTINPVEINQYKKNLVIQKNTIRIKGNSRSSLQINNWVNQLSELSFVKTAELIDLKYSNDKKTTEFELQIIINS